MKIQVMMLMALLLLTACSPTPGRIQNDEAFSENNKDFPVELDVIDGELVVTSPPQGDDSTGKQNGWVGFPQGSHGLIRFKLKGEEGKIGCTNDPKTSAEWVMTQVVLSKFGDKETQKGEKFGTRQTGWIARAFPTISESGYLVNESISTAQTSAVLINLNNNNGQQMAFYEIEVQRCDGSGEPLRTDPGIGNRGGK